MLHITDHTLLPAGREAARGIVEGLSDFGVDVYGWDPLLGKDEIEGFGVKALDDLLQVTDYCPNGTTAQPFSNG